MTTARTLEDRLRQIETCYEPDPDTTWLIATCRALLDYAWHMGNCHLERPAHRMEQDTRMPCPGCTCGLAKLLEAGGAGGGEEEK